MFGCLIRQVGWMRIFRDDFGGLIAKIEEFGFL